MACKFKIYGECSPEENECVGCPEYVAYNPRDDE